MLIKRYLKKRNLKRIFISIGYGEKLGKWNFMELAIYSRITEEKFLILRKKYQLIFLRSTLEITCNLIFVLCDLNFFRREILV